MSRNYIIAVGGTGARCMEAVVYLAAAGLFRKPLCMLIIDPDMNNGNRRKTEDLIGKYHQIHTCFQPANPRQRRTFGKNLPGPVLFQSPVNKPVHADNNNTEDFQPFPYVWSGTNITTFGNLIDYNGAEDSFKEFIKLFYTPDDMKMDLNEGYRGRTHIGAVAFDLVLTKTLKNDQGLIKLKESIEEDLMGGETHIFVMGSVFGGTGAAAIPTLPMFLKDILTHHRDRLRFGSAMMIPYFSFPPSPDKKPGSETHMVASQAALFHYAQSPPDYHDVYLIGAPEQKATAGEYAAGNQRQRNKSHYAEFVAALAAIDFFNRKEISPEKKSLHFASDTDREQNEERGILWDTLPIPDDVNVKHSLISFATFSYFYKNFLFPAIDPRDYRQAAWYKDNFIRLGLPISEKHEIPLRTLNDFASSFLEWLISVGESGDKRMGTLFQWEKLPYNDIAACGKAVGNLTEGATYPTHECYDRILKKMDALTLEEPGTRHPEGLLIYLLHQAVTEFCRENYRWK